MTPDANDLCVFAVRRGNIQARFDVRNTYYIHSSAEEGLIKVSLGELTVEEPCYGTSASAIKRTGEDQPKYIRITDFDDYGIPEGHEYMTAEEYSIKHLLQPGDILFARTGGTVGKTYYYDGSIGNAVFAGYCIRFRFDESKVLPKFVYWYTKTDEYVSWVKGIQRPSGQPNINKEEYKSFRITLPDLPTQKKLVEILEEKLQERNQKLEEANRLLENMDYYIHSTLAIKNISFSSSIISAVRATDLCENGTFSAEYYHSERMAAIHAIKASGPVKKLSEIVTFYREIVDSSKSSDAYLGLAGVESQTGELSGVVEDTAGQAFAYDKDDVLYGRLRPYLNKVLFAEQSGICSTEFHVMRVKNKNEILPEYIAAILRSDLTLSQTKHMMTGNTHPRISNDDVKNLFIPVPDITVQKEIIEELHGRRQKARHLRIEAEQAWQAAKQQFERELLGE